MAKDSPREQERMADKVMRRDDSVSATVKRVASNGGQDNRNPLANASGHDKHIGGGNHMAKACGHLSKQFKGER